MSTPEQTYKPGDVVNGHRLSDDGTVWQPLAEQPTPPPPAPSAASEGNWFARHKVLTGAGAFAGLVVVAMAALGGGTNGAEDGGGSTVDVAGPAVEQEAVTDYSFVDGVLTTPELVIEITDVKTIPVGGEGNEYGDKPVIAFWYNITNLTDGDVSPMNWIYLFSAYQDNDPNAWNEIGVASLPDDAFLDSQTQSIKKGGTVQNAVAYELDDLTTPVELVASNSFGVDEIGRMTFNLQPQG